MKKIRRSMLLFIMLLTFSMISVQAASSSKVIIEKTRASVVVGKSITLRAIAKGKSTKIIWSSSNRNIATVSSTGKVTGKKVGKVTITAKANGESAKCIVTVQSKKASAIATAKRLYKKRLEDYYFIKRFTVKDLTGDGIPELIMMNSYGAIFVDTYTPNSYGKPGIISLIDGRDVFINRSKKVGIGYDYEYSYPQNINGIVYRDTAKSSYRIVSYKRYPTIDVLYEYAEFTGNFTGYMRRSVQKDGGWGKWVRISEDSYRKVVRSYTSSAEFILPKYNNTPANRNKYI